MSEHISPGDRSHLRELKTRLVAAMTDEQRLYQRHTEASHAAARWSRRAELAINLGDDGLARAALERAHRHSLEAEDYHHEYLVQKEHVERLKSHLLEMEVLGRGHPVRISVPPDLAEMERTADRLERWESRTRLAVALAELERDEVAERLEALERETRLERDLEELKRRIRG